MKKVGITIYGCDPDEPMLFQKIAQEFGMVLTITQEPLSENNISLVDGNRCISVSHKTPITHALLRELNRAGVEYISTRSTGYNHIDVAFAQSLGISVENVRYSPDSVADYTIMLMLMVIRNVKSILHNTEIHDYRLYEKRGKELRDMTVGVIGTGRIGSAVIDRLRGFGCRILAYDHHPKISIDYVSLDELLQQSDVITLHIPLTAETHHILNRLRIEQMKKGAYIINTGRGALIDTEALIDALESCALGGAALDVLEGEEGIFYFDYRNKPIENKLLSRLQKLPNVIITPHTAYYTDHALHDIVENTMSNCLRFEKEKVS